MPERRYIGALGAVCWATRSGTNLIHHNEKVRIERTKPQAITKGKGKKAITSQKQDNVVRFTNSRGEEIGRLETDFATWVAPLIDQKICVFEGTCVFAPERVRTNDTIYLQLRAYFLRPAFHKDTFVKPAENNRQTGLFEAKETQEERDLHLRQLAIVKLFDEINLQPSKSNAATEKHKRQGTLQAAEVAERYNPNTESKPPDTPVTPGTPSSAEGEEAEEGEELQQDQLDSLYKKAQSFDFDTPEFQPVETFAMNLRKYQKQALHWMISKERNTKAEHKDASIHPLWEEYLWPTKDVDGEEIVQVEDQLAFYINPYSGELSLDFPIQEQNCLGGILADEMGLGKTIEMMSLIHSNRSEVSLQASKKDTGSATSVNNLPRMSKSSTSIEPAPCTTLVVAPMSLLAQWQSEAERASVEGSMKVLMYYGNERAMNLQSLCCEANASSAPNVIITSYGTILSEFTQIASSGGNRASHGGLFSLDYFRVILDEAHTIKNRQSKTAKACYELQAKHRWVLTGTPIVNRLEDLFSLVHFLRVEPWSNFSFWKTFITVPFESKDHIKALEVVQTVLEPLVLRRTKDMKTPDGEMLVPLPPRIIDVEKVVLTEDERAVYNLFFLRAKRTFSANVEAGTLMKSYTTIFAQILRLRQSCCHPVLTRNKALVADEEDAAAAADIANGLADDMDLAALIERFEADMDAGEQDANKFGAHALKQIQDEAENECPICSEEPMNEQTVTPCWHSACKQCLVDYIGHQKDKGELPRCFNCREPVNMRDVFEVVRHDTNLPSPSPNPVSSIHDSDLHKSSASTPLASSISTPKRITLRRLNQPSSAKITALLSHLTTLRRTAPGTKCVVFSQFTSFLDLIEPSLTKEAIPFLRFDGSMAQKTRAAVIQAYTDDKSKGAGMVLLLSLRAGGVGLNLTMAERVFMMDPWWSWAVEAQAVDRVHRMGQEREVKVVRFVCEDSIEEKMLRIQERKRFLAGSLGMANESERKLQRLEDIKELLS